MIARVSVLVEEIQQALFTVQCVPQPDLDLARSGYPRIQSHRICQEQQIIMRAPIEVDVICIIPDRVLAQPAADTRVVPAVEVVLEARVAVERPGGEEKQRIHRRVALRRHVAEGVIDQVVDHGRAHSPRSSLYPSFSPTNSRHLRAVLDNVPHRVQVIRQCPGYQIRRPAVNGLPSPSGRGWRASASSVKGHHTEGFRAISSVGGRSAQGLRRPLGAWPVLPLPPPIPTGLLLRLRGIALTPWTKILSDAPWSRIARRDVSRGHRVFSGPYAPISVILIQQTVRRPRVKFLIAKPTYFERIRKITIAWTTTISQYTP